MKQYDLITIGTGSAMTIVDAMIQENPNIRVAVIDKDEPGGICLTRGCIPSKILLYPAELVRTIEKARELGVDAKIASINFQMVMERMRTLINRDIDQIREGLSSSKNIDYYHAPAEFVSPYTMRVDRTEITSKMIFLCIGSKINIPPIKGLDKVKYHTSDTVLKLTKLPESIAIIGGGYIAAEYGHFFSSMGSKVTIIGRNPQFVPEEEPEVSALAKKELERHMTILTNQEVREVREIGDRKELVAVDRKSGKNTIITAREIMVATGRGPITDILHPEKAGVSLTKEGWIEVNEYLETSQPNIWALGDADGKYPFKHVANYESKIVYYNAILKKKIKADYHAIPHAVFTYPEIASVVGLGEKEAMAKFGQDKVLIGFQKYEDTAKGEAMNVKDYFVKVIVEADTMRILGAHIVGPYASILIHEIIPLMYTENGSYEPISDSIHIHPALSEVVDRAFQSLVPAEHYQHMKQHSHELVAA